MAEPVFYHPIGGAEPADLAPEMAVVFEQVGRAQVVETAADLFDMGGADQGLVTVEAD